VSSMGAEQIRQIAAWLAATDIGLLELRGPTRTLLLRHDGAAVDVVESDGAAPFEPAAAPAAPDTLTTVTAPWVGVFLHRHPLREDALAVPGTPVQAGQALGLLQVGLLLLPVPAPAAGTVLELLAAHGAVVGYATPLVTLHNPPPP
jgi:acetyl-CoA carboxylase biotin carboxyl carrier protein